MNDWSSTASQILIDKTVAALKINGIEAIVVEDAVEAKREALKILPKGVEVLTMTSVTVDALGLAKEINESGDYVSLRIKLNGMDRNTDGLEMQKIGAAPSWSVGSVHAVTTDGEVVIASNTGSQLGAYAYGSEHVLWMVGTQKIVESLADGLKRVDEYVLPLESERAKIAYGVAGSNVSKLLIIKKEIKPGRIRVILIKQKIGF